MNKNSLWSQPNVARKASNSETLHSGYEVDAMPQEYISTWPLNFADGFTAQWCILDFRAGYPMAFMGDARKIIGA